MYRFERTHWDVLILHTGIFQCVTPNNTQHTAHNNSQQLTTTHNNSQQLTTIHNTERNTEHATQNTHKGRREVEKIR